MSKIASFIGYYKISQLGIVKVLARQEVTVPHSRVTVGGPAIIAAGDLVTQIVDIVDGNELFPVLNINANISTSLTGLLAGLSEDAVTNSSSNSIKFGLIKPNFGTFKGKAVLVITFKSFDGKHKLEVPIETQGE